jgi:microcystin degradation protein MlrC
MRIGVFGLSEEAMIASPGNIDLSTCLFWRGAEMLSGDLWIVRGILERLRQEPDVEIVPIMLVRCRAAPAFSQEQFDAVASEILDLIASSGPLDGLIAANHGALEVHGAPMSGDSVLMRRIRRLVGPDLPIAVALDMHGQLSPTLLADVQAFSAFRTAPHRDDDRTGSAAAGQLLQILKEGARPRTAAVHIPIFVPGEMAMTDHAPMKELYARLADFDGRPEVMDSNIMVGFAWNDLPWIGMSAVVTTDGDIALARTLALELAARIWDARRKFGLPMPAFEVAEGLRKAAEAPKPVLLSDSGDNVTAGALGDLTLILQQALSMPELDDIVIVNIVSPRIVAAAHAVPVGSEIEIDLGADHRSRPKQSCVVKAVVEMKGDELVPPEVFKSPSAPWARLRMGHVTATFHQKRLSINSPQFLPEMGIDPMKHAIYVYKVGYLHPSLEDLGAGHILLLSDGTSNLDLKRLTYSRIQRPAFPFDDDMQWTPESGLYDDGRGD